MSLNYLTIDEQKNELNIRCNDVTIDGDLIINSNNAVSFTPTISVSGGTTTYSIQRGRYIKIGKLYIIMGHVIFNTTGTGNLTFNLNIPDFTFLNVNLPQNGICVKNSDLPNLSSGAIGLFCKSVQNTSNITVSELFDTGAPTAFPTPTSVDADFQFTITAISN